MSDDPFADLDFGFDDSPDKSAFKNSSFPPAKIKRRSNEKVLRNSNYELPQNTDDLVGLGDGDQLIEIVNRLRDQGAHLEIDLPIICLCGQQSCGKSSVSESISGVPLPRASGTCTRCPTEVRLVYSDDRWSASVSIRYEWDDKRNRALATAREEGVGTTTVVAEVEYLVAQAQNRILENGGLQFSRNLVVVNIHGPTCKNLTIVDLPGLIFATEKRQDQRYIRLVKDLVEDCIRKPNTLIAACVSAKDDMENQIINTLVRKHDPQGVRTIGIVTKVDTIEEGLESKWMDIIEGKRYPLQLGYCCVKNPSQRELDLHKTYEEYRADELHFFQSHTVWSTLSAEYLDRMGSPGLVKHMSDTLSALVKTQLPKIKRTVAEKIQSNRDKLITLPPKPVLLGTAKDTIMCVTLEFVDEIKEFVKEPGGEFWTRCMKVFSHFFRQLEECKPRFHTSSAEVKKNKLGVESYDIKSVMRVSKDQTSRSLHFSASPRARKHFLKVSMRPWSTLTSQCIQNCGGVLHQTLAKLMRHHFGSFPRLMGEVKKNLDILITMKATEVQAEVAKLEHRETFEFTLSKSNLRHVYNQAFQQLHKLFDEEAQDTIKKLNNSGESYLVEEALMVMAEALSYYDLSYRRYGDVVAMSIEHTMFRDFADRVHNHLFGSLKILTEKNDGYFERLLIVEDNPLVKQREQIELSLERLEKIQEELAMVPIDFDRGIGISFEELDTGFENTSFDDLFNNDEKEEPKEPPSVTEPDRPPSDYQRHSAAARGSKPNPKHGSKSGDHGGNQSISSDHAKKKKNKKGWFR